MKNDAHEQRRSSERTPGRKYVFNRIHCLNPTTVEFEFAIQYFGYRIKEKRKYTRKVYMPYFIPYSA